MKTSIRTTKKTKSKSAKRAPKSSGTPGARSKPRAERLSLQSEPLSKPAHREALLRLCRVRGHLDKVIEMVEEGRACTDILQQLSAVISALGGCRTLLFSGHLKTCLRPALKSGHDLLIDEIEKLSSRVMKAN